MVTVTFIPELLQASKMRKFDDFAGAVACYEAVWEAHQAQFTCWDAWGYAFCLGKTGRHLEALAVCRFFWPSFKTHEPLRQVYAWSIYHTEIAGEKRENSSLSALEKAVTGIVRLCRQEDTFAPYTLAVMALLDRFNKQQAYPAVRIAEWCDLLRPELIDDKPYVFTDDRGRERKLASKREQYFLWLTKALLHLKRFVACIAAADRGLSCVAQFSNHTDLWLKRNKALAMSGSGQTEAALQLLQPLFSVKREWFIAGEVAAMLHQTGNSSEALVWFLKAVNMPGDTSLRVPVFKGMGAALLAQGATALALQHYELVSLIRAENNWRRDEEVENLLAEHQYEVGRDGSSVVLLPVLRKSWESLAADAQPRLRGKVASMLPHGKAGFILADDGQSYYFELRSIRGNSDAIAKGCRMSFILEAGFDRKKNQQVMNARDLLSE